MLFKQDVSDLDKRLELQSSLKTPNGQGGFVTTFATYATVWGSLWPVSAKEVVQNNQTIGTITHRSRIRFRRGVKMAHRIKFKNRYFNMVSIINPEECNEWLDLLCKEVAG